jgi:hypothetical protein
LKKELDELKKKLKEDEKEKAESEARRKEKEGLLRQSALALLGNFQCLMLEPSFLNFIVFQFFVTYLLQKMPTFLLVLEASSLIILLPILCPWSLSLVILSVLFPRRTRLLCQGSMP